MNIQQYWIFNNSKDNQIERKLGSITDYKTKPEILQNKEQ